MINYQVRIIYPNPQFIAVEQLQRWASDNLANNHNINRNPTSISPEEAVEIVNKAGVAEVELVLGPQIELIEPSDSAFHFPLIE